MINYNYKFIQLNIDTKNNMITTQIYKFRKTFGWLSVEEVANNDTFTSLENILQQILPYKVKAVFKMPYYKRIGLKELLTQTWNLFKTMVKYKLTWKQISNVSMIGNLSSITYIIYDDDISDIALHLNLNKTFLMDFKQGCKDDTEDGVILDIYIDNKPVQGWP